MPRSIVACSLVFLALQTSNAVAEPDVCGVSSYRIEQGRVDALDDDGAVMWSKDLAYSPYVYPRIHDLRAVMREGVARIDVVTSTLPLRIFRLACDGTLVDQGAMSLPYTTASVDATRFDFENAMIEHAHAWDETVDAPVYRVPVLAVFDIPFDDVLADDRLDFDTHLRWLRRLDEDSLPTARSTATSVVSSDGVVRMRVEPRYSGLEPREMPFDLETGVFLSPDWMLPQVEIDETNPRRLLTRTDSGEVVPRDFAGDILFAEAGSARGEDFDLWSATVVTDAGDGNPPLVHRLRPRTILESLPLDAEAVGTFRIVARDLTESGDFITESADGHQAINLIRHDVNPRATLHRIEGVYVDARQREMLSYFWVEVFGNTNDGFGFLATRQGIESQIEPEPYTTFVYDGRSIDTPLERQFVRFTENDEGEYFVEGISGRWYPSPLGHPGAMHGNPSYEGRELSFDIQGGRTTLQMPGVVTSISLYRTLLNPGYSWDDFRTGYWFVRYRDGDRIGAAMVSKSGEPGIFHSGIVLGPECGGIVPIDDAIGESWSTSIRVDDDYVGVLFDPNDVDVPMASFFHEGRLYSSQRLSDSGLFVYTGRDARSGSSDMVVIDPSTIAPGTPTCGVEPTWTVVWDGSTPGLRPDQDAVRVRETTTPDGETVIRAELSAIHIYYFSTDGRLVSAEGCSTGDVDGNGVTTSSDAVTLLRWILEPEGTAPDGLACPADLAPPFRSIDVADAVAILRTAVGLEPARRAAIDATWYLGERISDGNPTALRLAGAAGVAGFDLTLEADGPILGVDVEGAADAVRLDGNRARVLAASAAGLTDGSAIHVWLAPGATLVALRGSGVGVDDSRFEWTGLGEPPNVASGLRTRLVRAAPNPFNPRTRLEFELDRRGDASIDIFDVSGRRVRTIDVSASVPGSHVVEWDGRDNGGRRVASGVYLVRLHTASASDALRITLLK